MTALEVPVLEGWAIRLRPFAEGDVGAVVAAGRDPLIPLITSVRAGGDAADGWEYIERQHRRAATGEGWSFAIAERDSDVAVGQIGLWRRDIEYGRASVGYWVESGCRRRGYAVAALRLVSAWGSTLEEVRRLELFVEPWNEGSWRAAEAAGYRREGLVRGGQRVGGRSRDMYVYVRLVERDRSVEPWLGELQ